MIWDILEAKIAAAGLATPGVNLFRNAMPADVPVCIMLRSPLSGIRIDPHMPGYYKPMLQVIVRNTDPVAGNTMSNALIAALTVIAPEVHSATAEHGQVKLHVFYPRDLPIQYPRLDGNGLEWSNNFVTAFSIQTL